MDIEASFEESIGLIRALRIPSVLPDGVVVECVFETALKMAGRAFPVPDGYEIWHELVVDQGALFAPWKGLCGIIRLNHQNLIDEKVRLLQAEVERLFDDSHGDAVESMQTEIEYIYRYLICGEFDPLFDKMCKAYAGGGWPCGWKGKYPEGQLVVYWPHAVPPQFEPPAADSGACEGT